MKNRIKWETKSLEWIHRVREEMDREIIEKGMTPSEWIKARGKINIESICRKLGLNNVIIVKDRPKVKLPG